jgi:periplasmic protein TonB
MATAEHVRHDARIHAAREVAVALAAVLALHAALALWLLSARPAHVEPRETPRTIVARLLSAPGAPALTMPPRAAVPVPAHATPQPHKVPETSRKIAAPPQPAPQPTTPARHEEAVAPTPPAPTETPTTAAPAATQPAAPQAHAAAPPQATQPPKPVSHVDCSIGQPDYPDAARRRGESGTAVVRFVVAVDGRIESTRLVKSSGYTRLDNAALDALRSATCHPTLDAGVPVRVVFEQPFVFGISN